LSKKSTGKELPGRFKGRDSVIYEHGRLFEHPAETGYWFWCPSEGRDVYIRGEHLDLLERIDK
jgi:hypothetical protein